MKLYRVFTDKDAIMVEINPMALDSSGKGKCGHCTTPGWGCGVGAATYVCMCARGQGRLRPQLY